MKEYKTTKEKLGNRETKSDQNKEKFLRFDFLFDTKPHLKLKLLLL